MKTTNETWGDWSHIPTTAAGARPSTVRRDIVADSQFGPAFIAGDVLPSHATLISAAPDLLSALESLIIRANSLDQSATHDGLQNCQALAFARAAITKAKGGE